MSHLGYNLVLGNDCVSLVFLRFFVFFLVGICHLVNEHLPLIFVALLQELLVNSERAHDDVLFIVARVATLSYCFIKSDRVDVN